MDDASSIGDGSIYSPFDNPHIYYALNHNHNNAFGFGDDSSEDNLYNESIERMPRQRTTPELRPMHDGPYPQNNMIFTPVAAFQQEKNNVRPRPISRPQAADHHTDFTISTSASLHDIYSYSLESLGNCSRSLSNLSHINDVSQDNMIEATDAADNTRNDMTHNNHSAHPASPIPIALNSSVVPNSSVPDNLFASRHYISNPNTAHHTPRHAPYNQNNCMMFSIDTTTTGEPSSAPNTRNSYPKHAGTPGHGLLMQQTPLVDCFSPCNDESSPLPYNSFNHTEMGTSPLNNSTLTQITGSVHLDTSPNTNTTTTQTSCFPSSNLLSHQQTPTSHSCFNDSSPTPRPTTALQTFAFYNNNHPYSTLPRCTSSGSVNSGQSNSTTSTVDPITPIEPNTNVPHTRGQSKSPSQRYMSPIRYTHHIKKSHKLQTTHNKTDLQPLTGPCLTTESFANLTIGNVGNGQIGNSRSATDLVQTKSNTLLSTQPHPHQSLLSPTAPHRHQPLPPQHYSFNYSNPSHNPLSPQSHVTVVNHYTYTSQQPIRITTPTVSANHYGKHINQPLSHNSTSNSSTIPTQLHFPQSSHNLPNPTPHSTPRASMNSLHTIHSTPALAPHNNIPVNHNSHENSSTSLTTAVTLTLPAPIHTTLPPPIQHETSNPPITPTHGRVTKVKRATPLSTPTHSQALSPVTLHHLTHNTSIHSPPHLPQPPPSSRQKCDHPSTILSATVPSPITHLDGDLALAPSHHLRSDSPINHTINNDCAAALQLPTQPNPTNDDNIIDYNIQKYVIHAELRFDNIAVSPRRKKNGKNSHMGNEDSDNDGSDSCSAHTSTQTAPCPHDLENDAGISSLACTSFPSLPLPLEPTGLLHNPLLLERNFYDSVVYTAQRSQHDSSPSLLPQESSQQCEIDPVTREQFERAISIQQKQPHHFKYTKTKK